MIIRRVGPRRYGKSWREGDEQYFQVYPNTARGELNYPGCKMVVSDENSPFLAGALMEFCEGCSQKHLFVPTLYTLSDVVPDTCGFIFSLLGNALMWRSDYGEDI